jgi:hypothetical protein
MTHRHLLQGLLYTSLWLVLFFILAFLGWPGKVHFCVALDHCYCETIRWDALIVQPINTWSNLVPIFVGLYILTVLDKSQVVNAASASNPMQYANIHSLSYGFLVINIGIGSMFFHGSMTEFGGLLDNISMNMYISFILCYNLQRIFKFSNKYLLAIYSLINLFLGWIAILPDVGRNSFAFLVAVEVVLEIFVVIFSNRKKLDFKRNWRLLLLSLLVFGFAMIVWELSKTGAIFCHPDSFWQGHALWHYLDGLAPWVIFLYMRSETKNEFSTK